jgi:hypothetical protein
MVFKIPNVLITLVGLDVYLFDQFTKRRNVHYAKKAGRCDIS